ncbi:MAG TPA: hypothetical protein VF815_45180 [Myxococcaceae bacterium]|jgi:hypothetical protein
MKSTQSRLTSCLTLLGALLICTGCGGVTEEELATESDLQMSMATTEQAAEEEPRKVEDLMGGLEVEAGTLHVNEKYVDVSLKQLQAVSLGNGAYETTDEMTGEVNQFVIKPYPLDQFIRLWKYCSATGEWVFSWRPCPTKIIDTGTIRLWMNSSCARKVQSAGWGACFGYGSSGYSGRYYYLESWKCGVGTGYCVERYAARTLRFNYNVAGCNTGNLLNVSTTQGDFLCRSRAPLFCQ